MSFQPLLPSGGYGGWRFLNRTLETQQAQFARSPVLQREAQYFRDNIGKIDTAAELVADTRLLKVALGAFGLDSDLQSRFFIRKVLEEGTLEPRALANRLADKRYLELSRAFGFGDFDTPRNKLSDFADKILPNHQSRQFEIAVGQQSDTMRLALNLRRDLSDLAEADRSERSKWFTVLGSPPLRQVFETAYNLPKGFGTLDLDRQVEVLRERTRRTFGETTISQFKDPDKIEKLARQFILRDEINEGVVGFGTRGVAALQVLQMSTFPGRFPR